MDRRSFVRSVALAPLAASSFQPCLALTPADDAGKKDGAQTLPFESDSHLRNRYELTLRRFLLLQNPQRVFAVPIAAKAFQYIPAEFPEQPATVNLRAIAEQKGQPTTSWELRFLTDSHA